MEKILLRINLKKEETRLESITFVNKCKQVYYIILFNICFMAYLFWYAMLWITGMHSLSVFIVRKKKNVNILKYSEYDYIY